MGVVFEKRQVFKEDLKELTGSSISRNRELELSKKKITDHWTLFERMVACRRVELLGRNVKVNKFQKVDGSLVRNDLKAMHCLTLEIPLTGHVSHELHELWIACPHTLMATTFGYISNSVVCFIHHSVHLPLNHLLPKTGPYLSDPEASLKTPTT